MGKTPWRRAWQPTPECLPGKYHGQRSLTGYSLWSHKESDTTERLAHAQWVQACSRGGGDMRLARGVSRPRPTGQLDSAPGRCFPGPDLLIKRVCVSPPCAAQQVLRLSTDRWVHLPISLQAGLAGGPCQPVSEGREPPAYASGSDRLGLSAARGRPPTPSQLADPLLKTS